MHEGRYPNYDSEYDRSFTDLPEFAAAVGALGSSTGFLARFSEAKRLTLHFLFACFAAVSPPLRLDDESFDALWTKFSAEVSCPTWTLMSIANLRNFRLDLNVVSLVDGVKIYSRDSAELMSLVGPLADALQQDFSAGGGGHNVLVVTTEVRKTPDTDLHVRFTPPGATETIHRTLTALRLLAPGDVRIGRVFGHRLALFPFNSGGIASWSTSPGASTWSPGSEYVLSEDQLPEVKSLCERLARVEKAGWKKLEVALRSFSELYNREHSQAEDRVLDAITAIEALVGSKMESSFKVAFRVASLLAASDDERVSLFERVGAFYSVRSLIAHGGELKAKHQALVNDEASLRIIARRLILAFIFLIESGLYSDAKRFAKALDEEGEVDGRLLHGLHREALRRSMRLI